jgi:TatA/E family protein of Tat protein translocase
VIGSLGWQETVFIFLLALLLFGPKKLPELGRTLGKAITEFRRASNELKATFDREMSSLERETEGLKEVTQSYHNEISSYTYDDSSSYYDSGAYSSDSYSYDDHTATNPSSVSASAPEGAETHSGQAPEGTVPTTALLAASNETPSTAPSEAATGSETAEPAGKDALWGPTHSTPEPESRG